MTHWPKIPLGIRLFFIYFILVLLTAYMVSKTMIDELKPTVRQVTEEVLVDTANLLATVIEQEVKDGELAPSSMSAILVRYNQKQSNIYGYKDKEESGSNLRIYITNKDGIVIADSWQQDIGKDYSQWNDVYLTLRGKYGVRSTTEIADIPSYSVMHIAAPIYHNKDIIGSVTVAKSNRLIQPFIDASTHNVLLEMIWISLLVLLVGALIAWRINTALTRLAHYANRMGKGEKVNKPTFRIFYEYRSLSNALETMRKQLDGKQYIEDYVTTLTHELKSPISAIKGASEILQMPLPSEKIHRFANNIERESNRMQSLIDKLLDLARLEARPQLEHHDPLNGQVLLEEIILASDARLNKKSVTCTLKINTSITLHGDAFLLKQALFNLMDNALDFVFTGGEIHWQLFESNKYVHFLIMNQGPQIPEYALHRLTERFYSLPRENGNKSTGLGLNFVEQIVKLHNGELEIKNEHNGVSVLLKIPTP